MAEEDNAGDQEQQDQLERVKMMESSAENSDREPDAFEDAQDSASTPPSHHASPSLSTRSLTQARPISTSSLATKHQTVESLDEVTGSPTRPQRRSTSVHQASSPRSSRPISTIAMDDVSLDEQASADVPDNMSQHSSHSRSRSRASSHARVSEAAPKALPRASSQTSNRAHGFASSMPWNQAPTSSGHASTATTTATAGPPPRKLTGPFAWLSRNSTAPPKEAPKQVASTERPPSAQSRRNTTTSIGPIIPNSELMLSKMEEEGSALEKSSDTSAKESRNSLRDRFKFLRMREEAGITEMEGGEGEGTAPGSALAGLIGRSAGIGLGVGSPISLKDETEGGLAQPTSETGSKPEPPMSPSPPAINTQLPPGTVSGISAGPSAGGLTGQDVDWDLWQSVVYEGPSAVARTSPAELSQAIANGIPSAIRGVVWQVLAQSKNEELEATYRQLVVRGADKDKSRSLRADSSAVDVTPKPPSSEEFPDGKTNGAGLKENTEESAGPSSRSSMKSPHSTSPGTPVTNGVMSPISPTKDDDHEALEKLPMTLAERQKKAKEEAAALQKLEKSIKRDLGARTSYSKYAASAGLQDALFGVCKAYALYDEGVGYAQGMNFLIMPLLFSMPEEEAFCLLVRLMHHYRLRELFIQDMPGLHLRLYQFERLLEDQEPALYCHLHRKGVTPHLYATQWFLTLFAYRFPLQLVLRIYDLVLSEGLEGAILKFGLVLMQKNADTLLGMNDMAALSTFLKDRVFDVYIDQAPTATSILESGFFGSSGGSDKEVYRADVLVQDACSVKLTPELLRSYAAEWEEKTLLERERENEVEGLRSANTALSTRIRTLEERTEKFDTEHVQIASELVRSKVENESLLDQNESLKGQVEELRHLVESQPEEIEAKLKEEMDRIMKRNLEVHNDNQSLEEQMADMEKELVNVKMQYAEINSNHETLKQKWNDLRKALGD